MENKYLIYLYNVYQVFVGDDDINCIWFDDTGYWRRGNCELMSSSNLRNTWRINKRNVDCPSAGSEIRDVYWLNSSGIQINFVTEVQSYSGP